MGIRLSAARHWQLSVTQPTGRVLALPFLFLADGTEWSQWSKLAGSAGYTSQVLSIPKAAQANAQTAASKVAHELARSSNAFPPLIFARRELGLIAEHYCESNGSAGLVLVEPARSDALTYEPTFPIVLIGSKQDKEGLRAHRLLVDADPDDGPELIVTADEQHVSLDRPETFDLLLDWLERRDL
ncbi:uncharacterized protein L969DRAFT_93925 [Mixia osmundae IAM 14324]|uniref:Alpha/beta hydrolase n=1 Tax=Mixia osmundae (strain CBS 9802 / IAM 14324 / JCM 22182 / KY 12970) TaxID=764103 RepID=G7E9Z6_MIXOS|nr:uncharacterized protein L969DRAFT_93925 [Mixia osmundae IAM 14324]KEI40099.1 hypothetical protein L969DRAFT_93925 [Mixia osmundae IAM 14324]GAA99465.1 hypothetical protein E5Q_06164 [Mixia osmundae IAM 14324]